jgi:hypothetical protein
VVVSYDTVSLARMNVSGQNSLRHQWIQRAQELDRHGHFARYSDAQRDEVRRKGFVGPFPPDRAIRCARDQVRQGYAVRTEKFNDEMRDHFGLVGEEVREAVLRILDEVLPGSYEPPRELDEPPGCPFIFRSKTPRCEIYFKFQVKGTAQRPRVKLCSCHPPLYGRETSNEML